MLVPMLRSGLIGFALLLCLGVSAQAQDVLIKGKVLDALTSDPMAFVTVKVVDQSRGAFTDAKGEFVVRAERRDSVVLEFSYINYKTERRVLDDLDKEAYNLKIELQEKVGETQIISAAKVEQNINDLSISTQTLGTKNIDVQADVDIQSSLQQTPGVAIYDRQLSIRGSSGYTFGSGTRVLALLDGLPMLSPNRSSNSFDLLPTDNIAQIEVIKGASSVLYGTGAMGGVVNVITKEPSYKPETSVRIRALSFDSPANDSLDWDGRSGAFDGSIHAFHSRKIGNLDLTAQVDMIRRTGYRQEEYSDRIRAFLNTKYHVDVKDRDGSVKGSASFGVNLQMSYDSSASVLYWAGYPYGANQPGPNTVAYQQLYRYTIDPHFSYVTHNGNRHIYRGRVLYAIDKISLNVTGDSWLNYHEYQYVHNWFKNRDDIKLTTIFGGNYTGFYIDQAGFGEPRSHQFGAFAQAEAGFIPDNRGRHRLNLSFGVRYQLERLRGSFEGVRSTDDQGNPVVLTNTDSSFTSMNQPVFRGGASFRLFEETYIRGSIGQALRSPSIAERFTNTVAAGLFVQRNPTIQVEKGYSAELGLRQLIEFGDPENGFSGRGFIDAALFTMQFDDMVEFQLNIAGLAQGLQTGNIPFQAQNISNASITGGEMVFQMDMRYSNWDFGVNGGITLLEPINPDGLEELDDTEDPNTILDPTSTLGIEPTLPNGEPNPDYQAAQLDQPRTLKYRNRVLWRGSGYVSWKNVTLTVNHRYTSQVENIDKLFALIIPDAVDARDRLNRGFNIFDFIVSYDLKNNNIDSRISLHVFNAFNTEFLYLPGRMGEQRRFALQYKVMF